MLYRTWRPPSSAVGQRSRGTHSILHSRLLEEHNPFTTIDPETLDLKAVIKTSGPKKQKHLLYVAAVLGAMRLRLRRRCVQTEREVIWIGTT